jgi:hypothetical protein
LIFRIIERLRCIPVRERKGLPFAPRKGLERKARTTTAGRRRTCSGKPDRRVERGLRPNVLTGLLLFTVLSALALGDTVFFSSRNVRDTGSHK